MANSAEKFYTPRSVVRVLVETLEPYEGHVYDPCCGSGRENLKRINYAQ